MTERALPTVRGRQLNLTRIHGPNGEFDVAFVGTDKDGVRSYFYHNENVHFFLLVELHTQPEPSWQVTSAGNPRPESPLKVDANYEAVLRQDIEFFFKTRDWSQPEKAAEEGIKDWPVTFSWGAVRT